MARQAGLQPAPLETTFAGPTFDGPLVNVPSLDVIELLPAGACADRLRALRQRAADLHMLIPDFEQLQDVNIEKIKAEGEVRRRLASPHDDGFNLQPDDHRVIAAQKRLDKLTGDAKRLTELREVRSAAWQTVRITLSNVENWLLSGRPGNTTLEAVEIEVPKLLKGETTVLDGVERLRRRCRELRADAHRIASAPNTSNYAKAQMRKQVEQLAARGEANVAALVEQGDDGKLQFQRELLRVQLHNIPKAPAAIGYCEAVDPVALVAWLLKETLIKRLDAEIDAEADDKAALTPEARQQHEAEVMGDMLAVERDESALVWRGQSEGLPVEHRADCSPLALLGVKLVTQPRAIPTMTSSPQHAWEIVTAGQR